MANWNEKPANEKTGGSGEQGGSSTLQPIRKLADAGCAETWEWCVGELLRRAGVCLESPGFISNLGSLFLSLRAEGRKIGIETKEASWAGSYEMDSNVARRSMLQLNARHWVVLNRQSCREILSFRVYGLCWICQPGN